MTKVNVSASTLRWGLERAGKPEVIRKKFPKLTEWLEGQSLPTLHQLQEFAKATSTPLGYLFLSEPPKEQLPIPYFRTLGDERYHRPSPDFLETVYIMQRRQDWMCEYLIGEGDEPLNFVRSARITDEPQHIADKIRHTLGLQEGWADTQNTWSDALKSLRNSAEEVGILVVVNSIVGNNTHRKLEVKEFRGFVLVNEYAPLIFINSADAQAAQMFTLAHELAHIWLGSSAAFDLRELKPANNETEQTCNQIAAEFLVPSAELHKIWPSIVQEREPFQEIARRFKVSELVAARRARDLQLITMSEYLEFYQNYPQRETIRSKEKGRGGDFYSILQPLRLGRRFTLAVIRAVKEGKLLYRDAYRLTGLYGKTFEQYATEHPWRELL